MERIDEQASLVLLRRANERFRGFFARFSGAPVLGTDEEVEALLQVEQTLQSVGAFLDGRLQRSKTAQVCDELAHYRVNLVRLRHELATMQSAAIGCRARLASRQKHLQAARPGVLPPAILHECAAQAVLGFALFQATVTAAHFADDPVTKRALLSSSTCWYRLDNYIHLEFTFRCLPDVLC